MKVFKQVVTVLLFLCATVAHAEVVEGRDYKILSPPQPTSRGKTVEVQEFFFYGCPHCFHLYPLLDEWEKQKPKDVELEYVPTIFNDAWEPMAHTFYALEVMGVRKRLHAVMYDAWNVNNIDLSDQAKITAFLSKNGVDPVKFGELYNSFTIQSKIMRSNRLVQDDGIRGTPSIVVDGKYVISGLQPQETIRVLDEVVKIARKVRHGHS